MPRLNPIQAQMSSAAIERPLGIDMDRPWVVKASACLPLQGPTIDMAHTDESPSR
jgi:hypothetical protein